MNQNPEQIARDTIDKMLEQAGWIVQPKKRINLNAGMGVAVTEYQTDIGPADYILFINKKPVGIIEAKRPEEGIHFTAHESQTEDYVAAKLKYFENEKLVFLYESTGQKTQFTDHRDPKPQAREVFTFHRPETFVEWLRQGTSLRSRLHDLPILPIEGLRDCQVTAINNLEASFKHYKPKALIQMATGSGKTFTAITFIYRLLKFSKAKRILFLVDTKNLGEQAEQEFKSYQPQDDNRLFPELYGVTRLSSSFIPTDSQVYISTIQRLYSILKDTPLDERDEEENPNESKWQQRKEPMPVVYSDKTPMEFFDFIVIDECHRSIYNLWKQVLDYFDVFQIGLTATPDNRTFGYFEQNVVSDYGYLKAVEDGVLVPYNVYEITTKITGQGAKLEIGEYVDRRERLTRKKVWEQLDEDVEYSGKQLDDKVINPNQIRLIIQTMRDALPGIFPDRVDTDGKFEVPKTLIFAKSDSHADDIIRMVREEFAEENKFCKKVTYRSEEDPKSILQQFRNEYYPRIAVTVDMIATGTDIRPLEVLLFMRDVKSRSYYEQMKGRGTRTCSLEQLQQTGTKTARFVKDHFVIIDAIGVEKSQKTDSRPLEKKPGMSFKEVVERVGVGQQDEALLTTLASRLLRLNKQINEREKQTFAEKANGKQIADVAKQLLNAYDPDTLENIRLQIEQKERHNQDISPAAIEEQIAEQHKQLIEQATALFSDPDVREYLVDVRKKYDQVIDHVNADEIVKAGWVKDSRDAAESLVTEFVAWIETHKTEITALQIFYGQPYRRRELTYDMINTLAEAIKTNKPKLAPLSVWQAYEQLEKASGKPKNELIALVSLIRHISGIDETLTPYDKIVDNNFRAWVFKKQAGALKFTEEQMQWLRMVKEHVAASFHIEQEDFDYNPFNAAGGLGKMWQLFGEETDGIINELNETLTA